MTLEQLHEALDRIPNVGAINKARRRMILLKILIALESKNNEQKE